MKRNVPFCLLAALAFSLPLSATAQASLITNGSFELPDVTTGTPGDSGANPTIPGWTLDLTSGDDIRVFDGDFFGGGVVAQDGDQYLGFTSFGGTDGGILSQSFATQIGKTYTVSFWANNASFEPSTHRLDVTVDTTVPTTLAALPSASNEWQFFSFTFDATAVLSTLSFESVIVSGDSSGTDILLDNVSVVPEPASMGLFAMGVIGLARLVRRRR